MSKRCAWPGDNQLMIEYHDKEWGVPLHNDRKLFEFMVLDAFQAGLSWSIVLKKREGFRDAFDNFEAEKIARYSEKKIQKILANPEIIRNKLKVHSTVTNAKQFLNVQEEFGTFDKYIWQFTGGKTIHNKWKTTKEVPAKTKESDAMSKDLLQRGFKFVGSTICYAFMQAAGMINDHMTYCEQYKKVKSGK
jgi:DNA-3-methyladenine glycosylase I